MAKLDIESIERKFAEFEKKVERLKEIEKELSTLDVDSLEIEANEIIKHLKYPAKLPIVEKNLKELKIKIEKRDAYRKTVPGLSDLGRSLAKRGIDTFKNKQFKEALSTFYESLDKLDRAYKGAVEQKDNYRKEILTTTLEEVHLGIIHTRRALVKNTADTAKAFFNKKQFQEAKQQYSRAKSELEDTQMEYLRALEEKKDETRGEGIMNQIIEEIKVIGRNIENCEIGIDSERVKYLYKRAEKKFNEAREKEKEASFENAIDILMETEKYFNEAFIIARKRNFSDDLLDLDDLLRKVGTAKRELRHKLRTAIGENIGIDEGIEEISINVGKILETEKEDFQIIKELGRGGFGTVYLAKNRKLDLLRALKVLSENYCKDPALVKRFLKEAQMAAKLEEHPNIIRIYHVGTFLREGSDKIPFIEMKYIEGSRDLKKILAEKKKLNYPFATAISIQICDALDFSHKKNILHKDIKPSNILLYYQAETKTKLTFSDGTTVTPNIIITDFGISGAKEEQRRLMTVFTPGYASPEQISGKPLDERTDIYSLGVMLYEMITGELPLKENPTPPKNILQGIPGYLNDIILKCLESEIDNRFSSAKDLKNALLDRVDIDPFDYGITR